MSKKRQKELKTLADKYAEAKTPQSKNKILSQIMTKMEEFGKGKGKTGIDLAFAPFKEASSVYEAQRASIKNTGLLLDAVAGPEGLFQKIAKGAEQGRLLFKDIDKNLEAYEELTHSMRSLAMVAPEVQVEMVQLTAVFTELGVNAADISSVMDSAVIGFDMTGKAAKQLVLDIGQIGMATGVGMQRAMENFSHAQKTMAYDSNKLMENFKGLQMTAGQTGVSFDRLTSAFGDTMDEFSGSANKAGSLNAILGRSVFNSIDLLGKTEADRVQTIITGIKQSVNTEALTKNKFQLKAVAEGLGLTPDETRRLLTGQMSVDEALAAKESDDPRERALNKMADMLNDKVTPTLKDFEYQIRRTRSVSEDIAGAINKTFQKTLTTGLQTLGKHMGDAGKKMFATADTAAGFGEALNNVAREALRSGQLKEFAESIGVTIKDIQKGRVDMTKLLGDEGKMTALGKFVEKLTSGVKPPTWRPTPEQAAQFGDMDLFSAQFTNDTWSTLESAATNTAAAMKGFVAGVEKLILYMKGLGIDIDIKDFIISKDEEGE